jgi:hypothetical protein
MINPPPPNGTHGSLNSRQQNTPLLHRRQFEGFWGIHKILNHRWGSDGWELLIEWEPTRGKAWEPSWEFQKDVTDDILDEYFNELQLSESVVVETDLRPLVQLTRRRIAQQVAVSKTQCRPRMHELSIDGLQLYNLAINFLEIVRTPTKFYKWMGSEQGDVKHRKLKLIYTKDPSDGVETWQVNYTKMQHVAAFAAFHTFLGAKKAVGAMRFDIGRTSNIDYACLGLPFVFKFSTKPCCPGVVDFKVEFIVCHGNGKFGTLTPPHLLKGMMRDPVEFNRVLSYVKNAIPRSHILARKGFARLPAGQDTLPSHVAVSDGEDSSEVDSSDLE